MNGVNGDEQPAGWASALMDDLGSLVCGQSPPSDTVNTLGDGVAYVSGPEHWDGSVLHLDKWTTAPSRIVSGPAIFVTVKGAGVGTVFPGADVAIGRDIYAFLPEEGISRSFVTHALRFTTADVVSQAQGDIPGLSKDHILRHAIPLPPANEQDRIAARVDELFSDLDAGVAALARVGEKLKLYRASVLKAAVEGALTVEWRAQHPHTEPASELLERILAERRHRWEEDQFAKFKAKGQEPPKSWQAKYKEPAAPDTGNFPPLPDGWCWATVEQVGEVRLGRQRAPQHHRGDHMRPYLRVANVYEDRLDLRDVKQMNFTPEEFTIYALRYGDVLLNEGQSPELVGRPALYRDEIPGCCYQKTLLRFRAYKGLLPAFALSAFRAYLHSGRFRKSANITTSIAHLAAERFVSIEFPLPPVAEQEAIVEAVEDQLSVIDHLEADIDAKLKSAQGLRQAILRHAFTGQLVPQDPNDEPASDLLKRIAAERERRRAPISRRRPTAS